MEKNYKLSNGYYFHIHNTDMGMDYVIYDSRGYEIDGGLVECFDEKKVLKIIAKQHNLPQLLEKNKTIISQSIIENFEEKEYNALLKNI